MKLTALTTLIALVTLTLSCPLSPSLSVAAALQEVDPPVTFERNAELMSAKMKRMAGDLASPQQPPEVMLDTISQQLERFDARLADLGLADNDTAAMAAVGAGVLYPLARNQEIVPDHILALRDVFAEDIAASPELAGIGNDQLHDIWLLYVIEIENLVTQHQYMQDKLDMAEQALQTMDDGDPKKAEQAIEKEIAEVSLEGIQADIERTLERLYAPRPVDSVTFNADGSISVEEQRDLDRM